MRTTLDLDDELMERLLARFPGTSKTRAVELAVEGYLRDAAYRGLEELAGAFPDLDDRLGEEAERAERERAGRLEELWAR